MGELLRAAQLKSSPNFGVPLSRCDNLPRRTLDALGAAMAKKRGPQRLPLLPRASPRLPLPVTRRDSPFSFFPDRKAITSLSPVPATSARPPYFAQDRHPHHRRPELTEPRAAHPCLGHVVLSALRDASGRRDSL